jgi:hypothetical protein
MTDPVARLEAWCNEVEARTTRAVSQRYIQQIDYFDRQAAAYRKIIAAYRLEHEWGNVAKQLHATGGNKENARQAASQAMYTADGIYQTIERIADALNPGEQMTDFDHPKFPSAHLWAMLALTQAILAGLLTNLGNPTCLAMILLMAWSLIQMVRERGRNTNRRRATK